MYQILSCKSRAVNLLLPAIVLSLVTVSLFSSCKKGDDGATGPAGPPGSANVMYSPLVYATNFHDSTIDNSAVHIAYVDAPKLADSIVQKGAVLMYFTYGGGMFPLPHTTYAGGKASIINFIPKPGRFIIYRWTMDNSNSVNLSTVLQYRYILIPGGIPTGRMATVDYKSMSYEEVCNYLHIPLQ
ncbi:MAG: hypothetical protein JST39_20775 [Bacteroidetes bacterium]|nr:hypothetical protein [Bacteroidota bacterium]